MRSFLEIPAKSTIAVVCNDAGAGNLIFSWLPLFKNNELRIGVTGPSIAIAKKSGFNTDKRKLKNILSGASLLLSGTSRFSGLEHQARKQAKNAGIKTVGVIDHWVNYENRFTSGGETILPDEIWVVDQSAAKLCRNAFPYTPVQVKPNLYLDGLVKEILDKSLQHLDNQKIRILYLLEPIRDNWVNGPELGEIQALKYFLTKLEGVKISKSIEILLRPHPSEIRKKYECFLSLGSKNAISISSGKSLSDDIAWSSIVVGCETYGLIVAANAQRPVFCSLPPEAPKSRLRLNHLRYIRDFDEQSISELFGDLL